MSKESIGNLSLVIVLGVGAQWIAWRLRVASILLLLAIGFLVGPVSGMLLAKPLIDPDALMGDLLFPFVSLSVALILYEGGLTLQFRELRGAGGVLWRLVTVGALITWIIASVAAYFLLNLRMPLALLLGAVLVVTGPTVIMPLLRLIRPQGKVGAVIKWEGIVIDPIGAVLAVLVFEAIALSGATQAVEFIAIAVTKTVIIGGGLGVSAGFLLALLIRLYLIPEYLTNAMSLMLVIGAYAAAEQFQPESGLLAATAMGITLANQRLVNVHHIVQFKEDLRVLLLAVLFVLLSARVQPQTLADLGWHSVAFVVVLIAVARPLSVIASTIGSSLTWNQRLFIMLMAPRGIVAASVASVFALRMAERGDQEARTLVPLTFLTIVGTVLFSSIVAPWSARRLEISEPNPQGILLAGANAFARQIAATLKSLGVRCLLIDTNRESVATARMAGLDAVDGSVLDDDLLDEIDLSGIGRLLAATPNNSVNVLVGKRFVRVFDRAAVYQVAPPIAREGERQPDVSVGGRILASRHLTWRRIAELLESGFAVRATPLTTAFTMEHFRHTHGADAVPLMTFNPANRRLSLLADDTKVEIKPGQTLIALSPVSGPTNPSATTSD